MRSTTLVVLLGGWLTAFAAMAQTVSSTQDIENILVKPKSWTYWWEVTAQLVPSARAGKGSMEFFQRDGKLFGRTTHMLFGNCEFEVGLRNDGFTWEICGGYQFPRSSINFDSADLKFPFRTWTYLARLGSSQTDRSPISSF